MGNTVWAFWPDIRKYAPMEIFHCMVHTCTCPSTRTSYTHACTCMHTQHSEAVPPDVYRKKPMCMSQYDMYSKYRIPHPEVDRVRHTPISESRHIIVVRNGHVRLSWLLNLMYGHVYNKEGGRVSYSLYPCVTAVVIVHDHTT